MAADIRPPPRHPGLQPADDPGRTIDRAVVAQALQWLVKLQSGAASAADQAACDTWRGAHPDHERAWQRVRGLGEDLRDSVKGMAPDLPRSAFRRADHAERRWVLKAFVLAATGGVGAWALREEVTFWRADYRTATGEQRSVVLSDGTQILLNTRSAINVRFNDAERGVRLIAGEIMVTSGKDPAGRPLVVYTDRARLTPIGTRFLVRELDSSDPQGEVTVLEGIVEVILNGRSNSVRLSAGQAARYSTADITVPERVGDDAGSWTQGVLVVERMRLDDFVAELARYRPGVLRCDPAVGAILVSGSFPISRTDSALDMLEEALPVKRTSLSRYWVMIAAR